MFEFELSDGMKNGILNNWLANPTGKDGDWVPLDLLQERLIRLLKMLAERRDTNFGAPFFRDVVSRNIQGLMQVKDDLRGALELSERSHKHSSATQDAAAMRQLAAFNEDRELPRFRPGRSYGATARNDFKSGHAKLRDGKLARWLADSLAELPHHDHRSQTVLATADSDTEDGDTDFGVYNSDDSIEPEEFDSCESSDEDAFDVQGDLVMGEL